MVNAFQVKSKWDHSCSLPRLSGLTDILDIHHDNPKLQKRFFKGAFMLLGHFQCLNQIEIGTFGLFAAWFGCFTLQIIK